MQPLILCLESTDIYCSAALFEGTALMASRNETQPLAHAEKLAPMVAALCAEAGRIPDAVAISRGPGSYTGLRIGASLAKGLCFGWNIPMLAIDTLQALAWSMRQETGAEHHFLFVPMTDARRMEVYTAVYNCKDLNCMLPVAPRILEPDDFLEYATAHRVVFAGSGASKWKGLCSWQDQALFLDQLLPKAEGMGVLAFEAYREGVFTDAAYFEPFYLKQFQPGKGSVT